MHKSILAALLCTLVACGGGTESSNTTVPGPPAPPLNATFDRLIGEWNDVQADGNTVFHEQWTRTNDSLYTGLGFVMSGNDTVFIEHLTITTDARGTRYSARIPSQNNGAFVDFELVHGSGDSLVFVNAAHDFPQRISYTPLPEGWVVVVSGMQQGKARTERFRFDRRRS
ncbi:MAG: DUF6265 family protein [Flavobacteriales bacterium]